MQQSPQAQRADVTTYRVVHSPAVAVRARSLWALWHCAILWRAPRAPQVLSLRVWEFFFRADVPSLSPHATRAPPLSPAPLHREATSAPKISLKNPAYAPKTWVRPEGPPNEAATRNPGSRADPCDPRPASPGGADGRGERMPRARENCAPRARARRWPGCMLGPPRTRRAARARRELIDLRRSRPTARRGSRTRRDGRRSWGAPVTSAQLARLEYSTTGVRERV